MPGADRGREDNDGAEVRAQDGDYHARTVTAGVCPQPGGAGRAARAAGLLQVPCGGDAARSQGEAAAALGIAIARELSFADVPCLQAALQRLIPQSGSGRAEQPAGADAVRALSAPRKALAFHKPRSAAPCCN